MYCKYCGNKIDDDSVFCVYCGKRPMQSSFPLSSGVYNGHEWVDLGLSVKWATCNVGASSPLDYGNYYAWGETTTKLSYTEANSKTYRVFMYDIVGDSQYDAARANWGGTWRMPTRAEIEELGSKCKWEWTLQDGQSGCKVTGPNRNSIFLPASGGFASTYYWSSTPEPTDYYEHSYFAYMLMLCGDNSCHNGAIGSDLRYTGWPIRPVLTKQTQGFIAGHEWVDLGLGVKWATCNIGASSPSDCGDYYAWGETTTKSLYTKDNSKTYGNVFIKDEKIVGDSQYDAARANWGGTWRLPTKEEFQDLERKCNWEWTKKGGRTGYKVTGLNGNNIFLPATERYVEIGKYWSSSPHISHVYYSRENDITLVDYEHDKSYILHFSSEFIDSYSQLYERYNGLPIRPVTG